MRVDSEGRQTGCSQHLVRPIPSITWSPSGGMWLLASLGWPVSQHGSGQTAPLRSSWVLNTAGNPSPWKRADGETLI